MKWRYAHTADAILQSYVEACMEADTFATQLIDAAAAQEPMPKSLLKNKGFQSHFDAAMIEQFPWMNRTNLSSMYRWKCYGLFFDD